MNAQNNIVEPETTVIMDQKEYANMRDYCMQKRELFKAQYVKDNKVSFTAKTMLLAFCGFLDF